MQTCKETAQSAGISEQRHPFVITAIARSARNAIELTALTPKGEEEKWNWVTDFLFTVDVTDGGVIGMKCGSLQYHENSFAGARMISWAMEEVLKRAEVISDNFEDSVRRFKSVTMLP